MHCHLNMIFAQSMSLAMLNDAELTQRFYQFLLSEHAQDIIRKNGFKMIKHLRGTA